MTQPGIFSFLQTLVQSQLADEILKIESDPHQQHPEDAMTNIDKEFQKKLALECAKEAFELRKYKCDDPKKTDAEKKEDEMKKVLELMKKYEGKIYEKYIQKTPVVTLERKNQKEDLINTSIKYNFAGEAGFLSDYNRLLRGYQDEGEFSKQQQKQKVNYEVKMPKDIGTRYPDNPYTLEKKSYVDTQANSKYYFPQDYQMHYDNTNIYNNKPTSDIGNQQKLYMSSQEGMFDPYASQGQGFGNSAGQGFRSQGGTAVPQQIVHNPFMGEDDVNLRRNIDMLGGIVRTVPNMERSLYDHELKNIEKNYRYHSNFDNTSNMRVNTLLQNPINSIYGPQFDTPDAIAASPQRGGLPNLQKPGLYYSPERKGYGGAPEMQLGQTMQSQIQHQPQPQPQIQLQPQPQFEFPDLFKQNALAERNMNGMYRPTFSSSKSLRGEKMDLLNPKWNLPQNI